MTEQAVLEELEANLPLAVPTSDEGVVEVPTSIGPIRRFLDRNLHAELAEAMQQLPETANDGIYVFGDVTDGRPALNAAYVKRRRFGGKGEMRWSVAGRLAKGSKPSLEFGWEATW